MANSSHTQDRDLARLNEAWPTLPSHLRAAMMTLVDAATAVSRQPQLPPPPPAASPPTERAEPVRTSPSSDVLQPFAIAFPSTTERRGKMGFGSAGLVTRMEAAKFLKRTTRSIDKKIATGHLVAKKDGRRVLIDVRSLMTYVANVPEMSERRGVLRIGTRRAA